jgi:DNA-binding response OmpR family regulator
MDQSIPIVFLTAKTMKDDIIKGFQAGADDYIPKPFAPEELLCRIQAILKRSQKPERQKQEIKEFFIGKYHFNYPLRILTYGNDESKDKLSPKESELLKMFCMYMNDILPRSIALKEIWGDDNYFNGRSMDVYIAKLRKYLKEETNIQIINVHGKGFKLLEEKT